MNSSLAIVFPGQGSQTVGMLNDIAQQYPEVEATFKEASDVLGYDLWKLVQQGPKEELDKTTRTQPALLTASYAIWRIIQDRKQLQPALLAGHSLGEYTALVCSNAISFADGVRLVAARGEYMQSSAPDGTGGLAAIVGLDDDAVKDLCDKSKQGDEVLAPANYNSPGQVVIAGHNQAIQRALVLAKDSGARMAVQLPVSVAAHSILMKPAGEKLSIMLSTLAMQMPNIPVVNNVDVGIYKSIDAIRDGLVRQLFMPVRWVETIQFFETQGIKQIIECGPGKVLSGLNKRIVSGMQLLNTVDLASLNTVLETSFETQD